MPNYHKTKIACYLGFITQAIAANFAPLLFLKFHSDYDISLGNIALISTFFFFTQLLVDLFCAKYVDRIGYRASIVASEVCSALGLIGLAFLPELLPNPFVGIIISVIIYAIGSGLIEVLCSPIVEACPFENKEATMSLLHSFYCWGSVGTIVFSTVFLAVFGMDSWKWLACILAIVPTVNIYNFATCPIEHLVEDGHGMSIKDLFKKPLFWVAIVLMICSGASELSMAQWASAYAESALGLSKMLGDLAGPCLFAVAMGISRVIYGKYGEKLDLKKFMLFSGILCLVCYMVTFSSADSVIGLISCIICGFSVGIMWPGTISISSKTFPTGGTVMFALLAMAGDLGGSVGPAVVGRVTQVAGDNLRVGMGVACIFPLVMIVGLLIMKNKKNLTTAMCLILAFVLISCSSDSNNSNDATTESNNGIVETNTREEGTANFEQSIEQYVFDTVDEGSIVAVDMPRLYIYSQGEAEGSLDFVTEPVAPLVSRQVLTWTPGYIIPPEPYYVDCIVSLVDADKQPLMESQTGKVKVRGNWTTNYDKKPLRIKFDEKQNLLGLNNGNEYKDWVLFAEYKDGSMLRNKTALSFSRDILGADGLYAADSGLVSVYINDKYWGVYLLADMQQVKSGRINITDVKKDYMDTDIGYLLEFDGYFYEEDELHGFHVSYADNAALIPYDGKGGSGRTIKCLPENMWDPKSDVGFTIKSDINSKEQHDFIASFVENAYQIMYEAAYNHQAYVLSEDYTQLIKSDSITPEEAVRRVVDVDSLADMYIISELTCDADLYWSSFYLSADFGQDGNKKLTFQAPWDFDSSMGNKNRCADGKGFYAANIIPDVNGGPNAGGEYETMNPWLTVLMYENWYQTLIKEKWVRAYNSGTFSKALNEIVIDKVQYNSDFEKNYRKWHNLTNNSAFAHELSERAAACTKHKQAADFLYEWLKSRIEFMNAVWGK